VVVDKTGTLTEGRPRVTQLDGDESALRLGASLEQGSEHPLAGAILEAARERQLQLSRPEQFRSIPGKGIMGRVDGHAVALGNAALLKDAGIAVPETAAAIYIAVDNAVAAALTITDPIKATTREALDLLRRERIRVVMLTGDSRSTAEAVARELGISEVHAEVLPDRKQDVVKALQTEGRRVAMAGDGINDAPALAQADVGIAMGTGTDIAMESAAVTLVRGDLRGVTKAIQLGRATMRNIRQNLFFAFIYNAAGIPLAAGALYPAFGLLLSPMIAAAAMTFSSVSVISNALRLRKSEI
jgi:P-type Cu+ transporter